MCDEKIKKQNSTCAHEMSTLFIIVRMCNMLNEIINIKEKKQKKLMHGWGFDVAHGLKRFTIES